MTFKDYFSNHAKAYASFRPHYPDELFSYLASLVNSHELAWDCGTGNGQAAVALAKFFTKVIATDPSEQQIKYAEKRPNIEYRVLPAEKTDLVTNSVDLLTIAQALHWFKFDEFYQEARRVLKLDGIIAALSYFLSKVNPEVDEIIRQFYEKIVGPYWPIERKYIDEEYKTIPFPFKKITTPHFMIEESWNLSQFLNYINTWSAVKIYIKDRGSNPIALIENEMIQHWGNPTTPKLIQWTIHLLVGRAN